MSVFRFKQFSVQNERAALKVGTDGVLLGAAMTIDGAERLMLDIGTGTGVIALIAAQRSSPECRIMAIDIDQPSVEEAQLNFASSPWSERLAVYHCALQNFETTSRFDLIFTNPPFYNSSLPNPDPRLATARHNDALPASEIFSFASRHLTPRGRLSVIVPAGTEGDLLRSASSFGLHPLRLLRVRTVAAKAPKRLVAEFVQYPSPFAEEELILQAGASRTPEYARLVKDFYL